MLYGRKKNSMLTNCLAACAHLTITVSEIERDIYEKIVILSYPLAFDAPVRGVPVGILAPPLVRKNYNGVATRWWKKLEDMFIRFDVIHERNGRTDRRTDGQTLHDSKDHAYASHRAVKMVLRPTAATRRDFNMVSLSQWAVETTKCRSSFLSVFAT